MKILIGIPSYTGNLPMRLVSRLLHLELREDFELTFAFTEHTFIEKARNSIARKCLETGHDYLFFIDDDTVCGAKDLIKMVECIETIDKKTKKYKWGIVCPPVLDRNGEKTIALFDENFEPITELYETQTVGAGGMSSTLIRADV
jgi:GT2 family glycosyltransferase